MWDYKLSVVLNIFLTPTDEAVKNLFKIYATSSLTLLTEFNSLNL